MSELSKQSAISRYNTSFSASNITNLEIIPGYGVSYKEAGVNRSARIPEIASGDADYIAVFQEKIKSAAKGTPLPANKATVVNNEVGLKQSYGLGTTGETIKDAAIKTAQIVDVLSQPVGKGSTLPPSEPSKSNRLVYIGLGVLGFCAAVWFFFIRKKKKR